FSLNKSVWRHSRRCDCALPKLIRKKVDEATARLAREPVEVVAYAEVERQSSIEFPIVLKEAAQIVCPDGTIEHAGTDDRDTGASQKIVEARETDLATGERVEEEVELRATVFAASSQVVTDLNDRERVGDGKSINARRLIRKRRRAESK